MAYFPYLEKDYIQAVLNPYQSNKQNNWKDHLNSEILQKYLEIKKKQKQKLSEILPRYQIFPKNHEQYNIYTTNYDLDRLQRIKNASNAKYSSSCVREQKNTKIQQKDGIMFPKSVSELVQNSQKQQKQQRKLLDNKSARTFYESKSTKSLTQTNISPSKFSNNAYFNKNPSKNKIQSDSQQVSIQNFQTDYMTRQTNKSTRNSKIGKNWAKKDQQNKNCQNKIFKNAQSTLTVKNNQKQRLNRKKNEEYYCKEKSSIQFNKKKQSFSRNLEDNFRKYFNKQYGHDKKKKNQYKNVNINQKSQHEMSKNIRLQALQQEIQRNRKHSKRIKQKMKNQQFQKNKNNTTNKVSFQIPKDQQKDEILQNKLSKAQQFHQDQYFNQRNPNFNSRQNNASQKSSINYNRKSNKIDEGQNEKGKHLNNSNSSRHFQRQQIQKLSKNKNIKLSSSKQRTQNKSNKFNQNNQYSANRKNSDSVGQKDVKSRDQDGSKLIDKSNPSLMNNNNPSLIDNSNASLKNKSNSSFINKNNQGYQKEQIGKKKNEQIKSLNKSQDLENQKKSKNLEQNSQNEMEIGNKFKKNSGIRNQAFLRKQTQQLQNEDVTIDFQEQNRKQTQNCQQNQNHKQNSNFNLSCQQKIQKFKDNSNTKNKIENQWQKREENDKHKSQTLDQQNKKQFEDKLLNNKKQQTFSKYKNDQISKVNQEIYISKQIQDNDQPDQIYRQNIRLIQKKFNQNQNQNQNLNSASNFDYQTKNDLTLKQSKQQNKFKNQEKYRLKTDYTHSSSQTNKIEQKRSEYYGEQFQRIKEQRDYLRKHFILHLQNKHTQELPYKQFVRIKTDESGKKLIINRQQIPTKKQFQNSVNVQVNIAE